MPEITRTLAAGFFLRINIVTRPNAHNLHYGVRPASGVGCGRRPGGAGHVIVVEKHQKGSRPVASAEGRCARPLRLAAAARTALLVLASPASAPPRTGAVMQKRRLHKRRCHRAPYRRLRASPARARQTQPRATASCVPVLRREGKAVMT
ncbi:hypothetical protein [Pantoea ananatis]|uniref:hypothetical protein n=1 Tax=Pantoea ananas TaxID=553 RepID=UPI0011AFEA96|nr:hypothetical protein [Pantoea ananatis]